MERRNREPEATAEASSVMNRWAHRTWGLIGVVAVIGIFVGVLDPTAVAAQVPPGPVARAVSVQGAVEDRKSTRLNSSHLVISYAVFCLEQKKTSSTFY